MSTYLLGFAVGDFSVLSATGTCPVPMALYAPRGKAMCNIIYKYMYKRKIICYICYSIILYMVYFLLYNFFFFVMLCYVMLFLKEKTCFVLCYTILYYIYFLCNA